MRSKCDLPLVSRIGAVVCVLLSSFGCETGGSTPADAPSARDGGAFVPCASDDEAPVPDGDGGLRCVRVGARPTGDGAAWPDLTTLPVPPEMPVRYVGTPPPNCTPDGTLACPYPEPTAALASLPQQRGTIVFAAGEWSLPAPLTLRGTVVIVGRGPQLGSSGTHLRPAGGQAFAVDPDAAATFVGFAVRCGAVAGEGLAAIDVRRGASARLRDVRVDGCPMGVAVHHAQVTAEQVTIRAATASRGRVAGFFVEDQSRATLASSIVRDGAATGVLSFHSHVHVVGSLIAENDAGGVVHVGEASGDASGGANACTASGPSATAGALSCISLSGITCNGIVNVQVQEDGASSPAVGMALVVAAGARATGAGPGDGVVVRGGARLTVDEGMSVVAAGSQLLDNARAGLLAQGTRTRVSMAGGRVASNRGPGIYVQSSARLEALQWTRVERNAAFGVGATPSTTLGVVADNTITNTVMGTLASGGSPFADGLSIAEADVGAVRRNDFSSNGRFGAVLTGVQGTVELNTGDGNLYGIGNYRPRDVMNFDTNAVRGRLGVPTAEPEIARAALAE